MSVESYAHKAAKSVVCGWLRDEAADSGGWDKYANMGGISWRVNRGPPHFGIWEEYPFVKNDYYTVWDEVSEAYTKRPPTYQELATRGTRPLLIVDIAVQHKGTISAVIEIVHKHPLSPVKLMRMADIGLYETIVLPARWVLGQVGRPKAIPSEFWVIGAPFREKSSALVG